MNPRTLAVVLFAAVVPGCDRKAVTEPEPTTASVPPATAVPVDHLAPGELLEGTARAFGLKLPRGIEIDNAFVDVVYASGDVPMHALASYFRARLEGGSLRESDTAATFVDVTLPGDASRRLGLRATVAPPAIRLEVRDTTPRRSTALLDESARWRRVGLTQDGHLADPTHLE